MILQRFNTVREIIAGIGQITEVDPAGPIGDDHGGWCQVAKKGLGRTAVRSLTAGQQERHARLHRGNSVRIDSPSSAYSR